MPEQRELYPVAKLSTSNRAKLNGMQVTLEEGSVLFKEGEETREMYLLIRGELRVEREGVELGVINEPGAYFGEMAAMMGGGRSATVKAVKKSTLVKVPAESVGQFIQATPGMSEKISRTIINRLKEMNARFVHLREDYDQCRVHLKTLAEAVVELEEQTRQPGGKDAFLEKLRALRDKAAAHVDMV